MPCVSSGTSIAGTSACTSRSPRSTIVTIGASIATFSPVCTWRLATMPVSGATTSASRERILRELDLRLGRLEVAARDVERRLGAVERILRDELVVEQPHVHRARLLGERELRARALDGADAIDEPRLEVGRIDVRDHLAGAHRLALAHGEPGDVAGDLGLDHRLAHRLQRARHRAASARAAWSRRRPGRPARTAARRPPAAPPLRRVALLGRAQRDGAGEAADQRQRRPVPPMTRRRVMPIAIDAPSRPRGTRPTTPRRPRDRRGAGAAHPRWMRPRRTRGFSRCEATIGCTARGPRQARGDEMRRAPTGRAGSRGRARSRARHARASIDTRFARRIIMLRYPFSTPLPENHPMRRRPTRSA